MPSYRSVMTIGLLKPGRDPLDVEASARSICRLESWDIAVVAGQARVSARFTAQDEAHARELHARILGAVRGVADVPRARLAAVVRGRSQFLT